MLSRLFGASKQPRDINKLIHDIADHNRPADYNELFLRLPALKLYFPVSPSATENLLRGTPIQVEKESKFHVPNAVVDGKAFVLLYVCSSDKRLGEYYAEIEGNEALRMVLRIPNADGMLVQAEGTAWVGLEKDRIANVLSTAT